MSPNLVALAGVWLSSLTHSVTLTHTVKAKMAMAWRCASLSRSVYSAARSLPGPSSPSSFSPSAMVLSHLLHFLTSPLHAAVAFSGRFYSQYLFGRALLLMRSWWKQRWRRRKILRTGKFGLVDPLFCPNSLIPRCEFTMVKLMSVVRSPKTRLVINLESLLPHASERFPEQEILQVQRQRAKSESKSNNEISISVSHILNCASEIKIVLYFYFFFFFFCILSSKFPIVLLFKSELLLLLLTSSALPACFIFLNSPDLFFYLEKIVYFNKK